MSTGLPYDMDKMAQFYEKGGTIDLSKINFPNIKGYEENVKSAFIYLRNTNYDMKYDFRKMDFEQKRVLLKEYLETKVEYNIEELNSTWVCIFYACVGIKPVGVSSILNELELISFQSVEFDYIHAWWKFILSLPMYAVLRLKGTEGFKAEETVEEAPNLVNIYGVMKVPEFDGLFNYAREITPANYPSVFTEDNNKLFESLKNYTFMSIMHFIVSAPIEKVKEILDAV